VLGFQLLKKNREAGIDEVVQEVKEVL